MCQHVPPCPGAADSDHDAARVVATHPEQGWSLLCNGGVTCAHPGELLPDGSVVAPHPHTIRATTLRQRRAVFA